MSIRTSSRRTRGASKSFPLLIIAALALGIAFAAEVVSPDKAEFGGQCAEGLAEGKHVMTDCSVNWKDKDGKTYCFSNDAAKAAFLKNPAESLDRARTFIAASNVESTEKAMENVNTLLRSGNLIPQTVPYDRIVATEFMPREFALPKTH